MPRKQSKKKGSIKKRKSKTSFGRNNTRINRKQTEIYNKFVNYLKTEKKKDYIISSKDVYDCVTNTKNSNYSVVKDAIINFIIKNELDKKPKDFNTSNVIEESLLDLIPLDCEDESSS